MHINKLMNVCLHIHVHMHAYSLSHTYTCTYTHRDAHARARTHERTRTHTHTYTHTHTNIHTHTHTHTRTHTHGRVSGVFYFNLQKMSPVVPVVIWPFGNDQTRRKHIYSTRVNYCTIHFVAPSCHQSRRYRFQLFSHSVVSEHFQSIPVTDCRERSVHVIRHAVGLASNLNLHIQFHHQLVTIYHGVLFARPTMLYRT